MSKLNNTFSKIETPAEWKKNLYAKAYAQETKAHRPVMKRVAVGFAAAAACATCAVAAGAATGKLDVGGFFNNLFGDEVTASKLESGEYQQLGTVIESDDIIFNTVAFVGDTEESYTLVEARLTDSGKAKDIESLAMNVVVLGSDIDESQIGFELGQYATDECYAAVSTDENGEKVFTFKVKNYAAWVQGALSDGSDLTLWVKGITATSSTGEGSYYDITLSATFNPEVEAVTTVGYANFDKAVTINGKDTVLSQVTFSDYKTIVSFTYDIPADHASASDEMAYWAGGEEIARDILTFANEDSYNYTICNGEDDYDYTALTSTNVKLYVNGEEVKLSDRERPVVLNQAYNIGEALPSFTLDVSFAPVSIENVEDITIEITNDDASVITISGSEASMSEITFADGNTADEEAAE